MPGEGTVNNLIDAGPVMAVAIAFILVAAALVILAYALIQGFKAFVTIYASMTKQLRLTRRAVIKSAEANAKGLSDVAAIIATIRDEAKIQHTELDNRVGAVETSITNLEGATNEILRPLVKKVDDLIQTVELLRGSQITKGDIDTFVTSVRTGLTDLEATMVQKFGTLVTTVNVSTVEVAVNKENTDATLTE